MGIDDTRYVAYRAAAMETFVDLITAFGGPAKFAGAIDVKPFHAQTMKTRGSVPPAYWSRVVAAASVLKIAGVTYETLTKMAERRADMPAAPELQTGEASAA